MVICAPLTTAAAVPGWSCFKKHAAKEYRDGCRSVALLSVVAASEDLKETRLTSVSMACIAFVSKVLGAVANILDRCVGARAKRGVGGTASKVGGSDRL